MSKEPRYETYFDETMQDLFLDMNSIQEKFGLKRINSIILLKALLEEKNSILYDFLCATIIGQNPYKNIIQDCDRELKRLKNTDVLDETEKNFQINLPDDQEPIKTVLTEEVYDILVKTIIDLISMEQNEENNDNIEIPVYSEDILLSFADDMPKEPLTILKNNGVYLDGLFEYVDLLNQIYGIDEVESDENEVSDNFEKIPKALSDFVSVLSSKYKGVPECEILGRDKECRDIMRTLQKRSKKNVVLVGEAGVGKSSIAEKIAYDIANGNCPEDLKENIVLQLNVNSSVAGTMYQGMAEERFKLLVEYLEKHENVILFIDELHMVIGAGEVSSKGENDMSNALKPFLASPKAKVIGATTEHGRF